MAEPARQTTAPSPAPAAAPQAAGEVRKRLKRGELLFSEGENSRAMYLLRTGMLRIFKKKGETFIEIDTIRAGQIVGELAFLDGNPRSASAEALTECELIEIGGSAFTALLGQLPDWLKALLKTIVGRLRTASTRIRQLEAASTALVYTNESGARESQYVYLSTADVLRLCSTVLLVASRYGLELKMPLLNRYGNQIMQVPQAKITTFLEVLAQAGILKAEGSGDDARYTLADIDFLERLLMYLNEENLCEPNKRHDLSLKAFRIMAFTAKHLPRYKKDEKTGLTRVNLLEVQRAETPAATGKPPFALDEVPELAKLGYSSQLNMKSADEAVIDVDAEKFLLAFRFQRVVKAIELTNEQKRKGGKS